MTYIISGIVGLVIGIVISRMTASKPTKEKRDIIAEQKAEYVRNMAKLSDFIEDKKEVTNNEVESHLSVSDASAERYLDDLEKSGKLKQIGKTGHLVKYKVIK